MGQRNNVKEKYIELAKKYNLPDFDELNQEFEIGSISSKVPFILREIRRAMVEKFEEAAKHLEKILYVPDSDLMSLYESSIFKKQDLQEIFKVFKKLAIAIRDSDLLEMEAYDERKEADWIKNYFEKWKEIKEKIIEILKRKRDFWKKEIKYKSPKEYVG